MVNNKLNTCRVYHLFYIVDISSITSYMARNPKVNVLVIILDLILLVYGYHYHLELMKIGSFFLYFSVIWHILAFLWMNNIELLLRFMWEEGTFLPAMPRLIISITIPQVPRSILVITIMVVLLTFLSLVLKPLPRLNPPRTLMLWLPLIIRPPFPLMCFV